MIVKLRKPDLGRRLELHRCKPLLNHLPDSNLKTNHQPKVFPSYSIHHFSTAISTRRDSHDIMTTFRKCNKHFESVIIFIEVLQASPFFKSSLMQKA